MLATSIYLCLRPCVPESFHPRLPLLAGVVAALLTVLAVYFGPALWLNFRHLSNYSSGVLRVTNTSSHHERACPVCSSPPPSLHGTLRAPISPTCPPEPGEFLSFLSENPAQRLRDRFSDSLSFVEVYGGADLERQPSSAERGASTWVFPFMAYQACGNFNVSFTSIGAEEGRGAVLRATLGAASGITLALADAPALETDALSLRHVETPDKLVSLLTKWLPLTSRVVLVSAELNREALDGVLSELKKTEETKGWVVEWEANGLLLFKEIVVLRSADSLRGMGSTGTRDGE
jgi:hypothetical protein